MSWIATRCLCWQTRTSSTRTWSTSRGLATCGLTALSTVQNPLTAQAIGIGTPTGAAGPTSNAPGISVGGFTIGDAGNPSQWQVTNSFIWQDTVALTKGRHNTRFGVEFKRHQVDVDSPNETDGLLQIPTLRRLSAGAERGAERQPVRVQQCGHNPVGRRHLPQERAVSPTSRALRRTTLS